MDEQQLRIEVDRHLCYGFGDCVNSAPGVFDLDSEEKAIVADLNAQTRETILSAANDCPVEAIFIYAADSGEQLFP
ncbi:MAG: ferredoxin [Solirubrobacterales bacterium]